ncbi:hypothetical protein [Bartonella grahamii]|uniref:hypothetical protein n=1 Tax=Bartonella grahamii TaxID=33045 RepID=UPI0037C7DC9A
MHCVCFCHGMECGEINGGRVSMNGGEVGMKRRVALKKEERVWGRNGNEQIRGGVRGGVVKGGCVKDSGRR